MESRCETCGTTNLFFKTQKRAQLLNLALRLYNPLMFTDEKHKSYTLAIVQLAKEIHSPNTGIKVFLLKIAITSAGTFIYYTSTF